MVSTTGKYKFVVDCKPDYCMAIQKHMKRMEFEVKPDANTWLGDHHGIKTFKTKADAEKDALQLSKKYSDKLYQITVLPP